MARRTVEVRREEILKATVHQIEKRGMAAVRVSDIAASLEVSSGLVFYHFETKDALLVAALEFAVERDLRRLDKTIRAGGTPVEPLSRVLASYGPTGSARGWTLWIDAWAMALREPSIRVCLRRLNDRWRAVLEESIADGVESGDFRCADPNASVARIGALLDGLSVTALVYRSITRATLRSWVIEAAAAELGIEPGQLR